MKSKWVFKTKRDSNGNIARYKARLVAKGFTQRQGIDFNETFAPVIRNKSVRLMFALAARESHTRTDHLDIKTAFLNANVDEEVYMEVPEGIEAEDGVVLRLRKALYGMKQAPRLWNSHITSFIKAQSFKQLMKDTCVFMKRTRTGRRIIMGLFVDDIPVNYHQEDEREWQEIKTNLMQQYEVNDLGTATYMLGMKITYTNEYTYIDQQRYIIDKMNEFSMSNSSETTTPEAVERGKQKRQRR